MGFETPYYVGLTSSVLQLLACIDSHHMVIVSPVCFLDQSLGWAFESTVAADSAAVARGVLGVVDPAAALVVVVVAVGFALALRSRPQDMVWVGLVGSAFVHQAQKHLHLLESTASRQVVTKTIHFHFWHSHISLLSD